MIDLFMRSPLPNSLAVAVLVALVIAWVASLVLSLRVDSISTQHGWYPKLLPAFTVLGLPAAIDLLLAEGIAALFALVVFIVLLANVIIPVLHLTQKSTHPIVTNWYHWSILITTLGGLAVAGYLTFIEATSGQIMCGPASGCSTVQNSKYSVLFGILPVGILGLAGYVGILLAWSISTFSAGKIKKFATLAVWAMCVFGVLFEIYLTFLEPFVIGATCMWCICSAVLMMILLLVSTPAAQHALVAEED